jgi:hypothetical protein
VQSSALEREYMRHKVNDLLRKGMIQKSISAYRAPISR